MQPILLCIVLICTLFTAAAVVERIPLNGNSSVYPSIKAMYHNAGNRTVTIELHHRRRYYNPTFLGRLSGTALYFLDLKDHTFDYMPRGSVKEFAIPKRSTYTFTYQPVVDSGTYYLEFLVIYATEFTPNGFNGQCVEDAENGRNIVNLPYKLELQAASEAELDTLPTKKARWMLSEKSDPRYTLAPLPTRYQKWYCGKDLPCEEAWRNNSAAELWQHKLYNWLGKPDWQKPFVEVRKTKTTHICLVGDSHSKAFADVGNELVATTNTKAHTIKMTHFWIMYPHQFNLTIYEKARCDYAIVCAGQWPGSMFARPEPYTASRFKHEMRQLMEQATPQNYTGHVKFYFNSINYVGLLTTVLYCPPYDHRSVPVIQAYNAVLKRLAQELRLQYIDLTHIIGPMWDSAEDFNHPRQVFTPEIEWILHHIFTDPPLSEPEKPRLVRVNGLNGLVASHTIYLVQYDVGRAFPNEHTFTAMGYDFADVVTVVDPNAFAIGPELPAL